MMIVDLSHEIVAGMVTYPSFAGPRLQVAPSPDASTSRDPGASREIGSLTLFGSTGTCIESPYQCHADRADLAQLPLERLVNVPIVLVRAFGSASVTATDLGDPGRLWGRAVLVHTGWARYWGTRRYLDSDSPRLAADAVDTLIDANVALIGIDSLNIDDPIDRYQLAHQRLLEADIPIVEHLTNLESVPDTGARLIALPAPVRAMGSFPIRAIAVHAG
jgi:arylformamidase